ncbi:MAG: hypothetical protein QXY98_04705 [Thermoplasmata archaeon]
MPEAQALHVLLAIVIIGLALSLLTPIAGFIEMIGSIGCIALFDSIQVYQEAWSHLTIHLTAVPNVGAWLILLSSMVVIASCFYPLGIGMLGRKADSQKGLRMTFSIRSSPSDSKFPRYELNYLTIAGASIALIGAMLPWRFRLNPPYLHPVYSSPLTVLQNLPAYGTTEIILTIIVVLAIGLSFVSSISGGFLVPSATALFAMFSREPMAHETDLILAGFIVAMSGICLIVLSYFVIIDKDGIVLRTDLSRRIFAIHRTVRPQETQAQGAQAGERRRRILHLNAPAVLALALGLIAISMPWLDDGSPSGVSFLALMRNQLTLSLAISTALFLIGTIANLMTPSGSILQTIGCAISIESWLEISMSGILPGLGLILAICSATFGVFGLIHPVFLPRYYEQKGLMSRLVSIIPDA